MIVSNQYIIKTKFKIIKGKKDKTHGVIKAE